MSDFDNYIFLNDVRNGSGNKINWKNRRLITLRMAQSYKRIDRIKYRRIVDCAGYLEFRRYSDNSLKLRTANFCKLRLCPMCNWRRSMKIFANVSRIMDDIRNDYSFIFLTLTVKNVASADLEKQIDKMTNAFNALCKRKQIKAAVKGWVRCFEITHNWQNRKFHPHYHVILAVDKFYYTSKLYICQEEFCKIWQSCLDVDYKPIVDIRTFKDSEKGNGKEVAEVAKYTIKSSNIMANLTGISGYNKDIQDKVKRFTDSITDEIVTTLDSALVNRRLIGFGGVFKEKHKELNLTHNVDDDLIHTGFNENENALNYVTERYRWDIGYRNYMKIGGENDEQT